MKVLLCIISASICLLAGAGCDAPVDDDRADGVPADEVPADEAQAVDSDVDFRWLPDDDAEKLKALEDQLGGFSEAMRKTGYRYNELYWAGDDRNWDYADYQLEKLVGSIELGLIRRPARAESAQPFLNEAVPALQATIDERDGEAFDEEIEAFTQSCNTCHAEEAMPFIVVEPLDHRLSPAATLGD